MSIPKVSTELRHLLSLLEAGRFREVRGFENLPEDLLHLQGVILRGATDFAHCPNFGAMVQELIRVREMSRFPEFKIVLITAGEELEVPSIRLGVDQFLTTDEIWIQIDCSSLPYLAKSEDRPRRADSPLSRGTRSTVKPTVHPEAHDLAERILSIALKRPVILQSAFFALHGEVPSDSEVKNYIRHLKKLRRSGAQIALIQVWSPTPKDPRRGQLKLKNLALIARNIRESTGLPTEFY